MNEEFVQRHEANDLQMIINQLFEDPEVDEIDSLMLTAQEYDHEDESKRVFSSQFRPVSSQLASRVLFAKAKPKGSSIVFADD